MVRFVLLLSCFLGLSAKSIASECMSVPDTPTQLVRESPVIFAGRITSAEPNRGRGRTDLRITLDVRQVWKGQVARTTEVDLASFNLNGSPDLANFGLALGHDAIILASSKPDGSLAVKVCGLAGVEGIMPALQVMEAEVRGIRARIAADGAAVPPRLALGNAMLRWRDLPAASAAFEAVLAHDPTNAAARIGQGRAMLANRQPAEALALAHALERDHPADAEVMRFVGQARLANGDLSALAGLSLREAELDGLDLSGQDLRGRDFSGARLHQVRLIGADLRGARFVGTDLSHVSLVRSDLRGAVIASPVSFRVRLNEADLRQARITSTRFGSSLVLPDAARAVKLDDAHLDRVEFHRIDMTGASMRRVTGIQLRFDGVQLSQADFSGSRLSLVRFQRSALTGARFENARLDGAVFTDTTMGNASFRHAHLSEVRFPWTYLGNSDFSGASLAVVDFRDSVLGTSDFRRTSLVDARLAGVALECGTLFPRGFDPERAGMDLTTARCSP